MGGVGGVGWRGGSEVEMSGVSEWRVENTHCNSPTIIFSDSLLFRPLLSVCSSSLCVPVYLQSDSTVPEKRSVMYMHHFVITVPGVVTCRAVEPRGTLAHRVVRIALPVPPAW